MTKLSLTYRLLKKMGFNYSEAEYGQVSVMKVLAKSLFTLKNAFLLKYVMNWVILSPIAPRKLRPGIWRIVGCKVGKDVFIGTNVSFDTGHAELIELEEHAHIAGHSILLCHQRNLSDYCVGDDYAKLPYKTGKIILKKGCLVGTHTLIMPGVTVGEGAIVGAYSLVTKDIPAWTIAVGRPAKVVKIIPERKNEDKSNI